jgi:hypothetical protein
LEITSGGLLRHATFRQLGDAGSPTTAYRAANRSSALRGEWRVSDWASVRSRPVPSPRSPSARDIRRLRLARPSPSASSCQDTEDSLLVLN